ncbi:MAG: TauD/TfdA family dioxygenase [Enhydrobacter sp.]|nr:TauD/TfdA family dioxygenase [Enhydrobacter sp.]
MTDVTKPLPGAAFGATVRLGADIPGDLPAMLDDAGGLLLLPGQHEISDRPDRLVDLSRAFGPEVEDYRFTLANPASVHASVPEIFIVSNLPPVSKMPPKRPEPPLTPDGRFPVQYPQRRGWHTDQSYRRPPPDVSLFYAVTPVARDRGQTLFASGILAYEALPAALKARVERLEGIHAQPGTGRSREAVLRGEAPKPCKPHERPQRQPVVRVHPTTGRRALYLCERSQMDWFDGPFVGMEPGPFGEGARLLDALMTHYTRPEFIYVHEWTQGDVLVWDNRCLVHTATWYDAEKEQRMMWRTTVRGNPGALYAGEKRSWIPEEVAAE